jgi:hypothetical protein
LIDPGLPAWAGLAQFGQDLGVEADADLLFGEVGFRPAAAAAEELIAVPVLGVVEADSRRR